MRPVSRGIQLVLILMMLAVMVACDGGEEEEDPLLPPAPAPARVNLQGTFRGTSVSTVAVGTSTITAQLVQAVGSTTVTGTTTLVGSPCFRTGAVTGTVSGLTFDGVYDFGGGQLITLSATIAADGLSLTGGYAVNQNSTGCSQDQGRFTLVKQ